MIRSAVALAQQAAPLTEAAELLFEQGTASDKAPILSGAAALDNAINTPDGPVVVSFGARWCWQCAELLPLLEALHDRPETRGRVWRYDLDSDPSVLEDYGPGPEDGAPPSESGRYEHQIPMTVAFADDGMGVTGIEIARHYGSDLPDGWPTGH